MLCSLLQTLAGWAEIHTGDIPPEIELPSRIGPGVRVGDSRIGPGVRVGDNFQKKISRLEGSVRVRSTPTSWVG